MIGIDRHFARTIRALRDGGLPVTLDDILAATDKATYGHVTYDSIEDTVRTRLRREATKGKRTPVLRPRKRRASNVGK